MSSPGHSFADGAAAAHELVQAAAHSRHCRLQSRDWHLAALAWEFLLVLEFPPSPHLLHSACRKPNSGKSTKTTEVSSAMDTSSQKRHTCASTQS